MKQVNYNKQESNFLLDGFRNGFDLGYRGPMNRQDTAQTLPFRVGNATILWNKMISEVELNRFAGPFKEIPYEDTYVQSPIGLVPKSGNKTRLIFHLSYNFKNGNESINYWTPEDMCSVKYEDIDSAVRNCLLLIKELGIQTIYYSKSDLQSGFRILGIKPGQRCLLIMKAQHPRTKIWFFFVDKCLPFGASISCSHFQRFSNALRAIVEGIAGKVQRALISNYLDDFLFIHFTKNGCEYIVIVFLDVCKQISFPVALEKTEWSTTTIIFLGMLLDGKNHTLSISMERRDEILHLIRKFMHKKKSTIKNLQQLAGHLNFINRAVVPGRAFTRRMYAKFSGSNLLDNKGRSLKPHHHVKLDREFRLDCALWEYFLQDLDSMIWPFVDLDESMCVDTLNF